MSQGVSGNAGAPLISILQAIINACDEIKAAIHREKERDGPPSHTLRGQGLHHDSGLLTLSLPAVFDGGHYTDRSYSVSLTLGWVLVVDTPIERYDAAVGYSGLPDLPHSR